jgi:DnaJ like chaperone protein
MGITVLKFVFIIAGLLYFFSPYDLLPDFFGPFGRIDDLLVIGLLAWKYRDLKQGFLGKFQNRLKEEYAKSQQTGSSQQSKNSTGNTREQGALKSPYEILGIEKGASTREVKQRYRKLVADYHPDKVAHLGEELQAFAAKKTLEINQAYEALTTN